MTYELQTISTQASKANIARNIMLNEKIDTAEKRSLHSFFDTHVIENEDGTYSVIEEGDYGALPMSIIDRIVYTADPKMSDEY